MIRKSPNFCCEKRQLNITREEIFHTKVTNHFSKERAKRLSLAVSLNKNAEIRDVFIVDKGHPDGKELHCISENGIIFILNEQKYLNNEDSFITILIARPQQIARYYQSIGINVPEYLIKKAEGYVAANFNNM